MTTTFKNLEEFHLARGSKNSLESDYGGENHDDLGIFQTGNSTKHILETRTETPILPKSSFSERRLSM